MPQTESQFNKYFCVYGHSDKALIMNESPVHGTFIENIAVQWHDILLDAAQPIPWFNLIMLSNWK